MLAYGSRPSQFWNMKAKRGFLSALTLVYAYVSTPDISFSVNGFFLVCHDCLDIFQKNFPAISKTLSVLFKQKSQATSTPRFYTMCTRHVYTKWRSPIVTVLHGTIVQAFRHYSTPCILLKNGAEANFDFYLSIIFYQL